MVIQVINGPNINMLGIREPDIYGQETYTDLLNLLDTVGKELNVDIQHFQSNHEGDIVDKIQSCYQKADAIVINPAAYTHTSVAILDALKSIGIPAVEIHISDVNAREDFRQVSYAGLACEKTIVGHGINGYKMAIEYLVNAYMKK